MSDNSNILFEIWADRLARARDKRGFRKALLECFNLAWDDGFLRGKEAQRGAILEALGIVEET